MKTLLIASLIVCFAIANAQETQQLPAEQAPSAEYDVCSRQGFYSCRLSIGCYYDGASASCKKVQPKPLNLTQETDICKKLGFYACTSSRGCQYTSSGCRKIQNNTQTNETVSTPTETPSVDTQTEKKDDLCSRLGFYACSSDKGCWIDPYIGHCAKIPANVQSAYKETPQSESGLNASASDDLCSRLGFYACSSDKGCWIDPYVGHCAKMPKKIEQLQKPVVDDHCSRLGFYACSSSRGCTLVDGKCKRINN